MRKAPAAFRAGLREADHQLLFCVALLFAWHFSFNGFLRVALLLLGSLGLLWSRRPRVEDGAGPEAWRSRVLTRLAMTLLSASVRQDVEVLLGRLAAHSNLYARVRRAQVFLWSQWIGLAFMCGAVGATLAFVVFTDLAFGWSTTLDVNAGSVHRIVAALSNPWALPWPAASPSLDLVESTRHFRVAAEEHIHFVDPIRYGGWWPFLVASMLFYGLLPRLLTTAYGSSLLGREVGAAIGRTPGVDRLIDGLTTPVVETQAAGPESPTGREVSGLVPVISVEDWIRGGGRESLSVVRWAEASDDESLLRALDSPGLQIRDAGGRRSLQQDRELVASLSGDPARDAVGAGISLCVRAFEPPVLEVLDFLGDLRRSIGPDHELCVLLVAGEPADHDVWRRKLLSLGDPRLSVVHLPAVENAPYG
jgi:hypothetical protein